MKKFHERLCQLCHGTITRFEIRIPHTSADFLLLRCLHNLYCIMMKLTDSYEVDWYTVFCSEKSSEGTIWEIQNWISFLSKTCQQQIFELTLGAQNHIIYFNSRWFCHKYIYHAYYHDYGFHAFQNNLSFLMFVRIM